MQNLNNYVNENRMMSSYEVSLNPLEMLALYTMIEATDCSSIMDNTKRKIMNALKSHVTYLLRECPDISNKYDYKSLFNEKTKDEANDLLDIIASEFSIRKK